MEERKSAAGSAVYALKADSEADTAAWAAALARHAEAGMLLALDGDLGAGKTRFAQSFATGLGVAGIVNSPTFTLIKEYEGRLPFYHMDVYRLSLAEAEELGLDEYFLGEGVTLVEWASLIEPLLPPGRLEITLEITGTSSRRIVCKPVGERYERWCRLAGIIPIKAGEGEPK